MALHVEWLQVRGGLRDTSQHPTRRTKSTPIFGDITSNCCFAKRSTAHLTASPHIIPGLIADVPCRWTWAR
jgi:hypothetical protein